MMRHPTKHYEENQPIKSPSQALNWLQQYNVGQQKNISPKTRKKLAFQVKIPKVKLNILSSKVIVMEMEEDAEAIMEPSVDIQWDKKKQLLWTMFVE